MRGQRTLFNELVSPILESPKQTGIGRNPQLIHQRDERMLYRYYFYTQILRKNYQDTIALLSLQFDLSELRVIVCIQLHHDRLKKIAQEEKPCLKLLQKKYPWLNWAA
jgi:hypothetical protein